MIRSCSRSLRSRYHQSSGKEVGPFLSIEQAILPQTTSDEQRTVIFSAYNLVGSFPAPSARWGGNSISLRVVARHGYRFLLWGYAFAALVLAALFALLSREVESKKRAGSKPAIRRAQVAANRRQIAGLFALDAFAGGFIVQSIVAYWFYLRFKTDLTSLGGIFFGTNFLRRCHSLAAPAIARRYGLLNAMVFTHLPSNFLLLLVPLMPTLGLAVTMLLARNLLSQLDVPTRQSYTMAVVDPDERAASGGHSFGRAQRRRRRGARVYRSIVGVFQRSDYRSCWQAD